jgi:hypothetical protein
MDAKLVCQTVGVALIDPFISVYQNVKNCRGLRAEVFVNGDGKCLGSGSFYGPNFSEFNPYSYVCCYWNLHELISLSSLRWTLWHWHCMWLAD